ncbi:tyrosine--tRNA ligase [Candidatus Daviesbacteria bacterium RIFCSPLOWO2_01_FULL_38_10]|nr:MAG: Tyrosine-tRNA ligase [Candidatus Daviesbacteria bacterium GW2011_GWA2_38_17]OGE38763.1 MAG: tyrosine--tRNA ligase [Candidatus Daviesbacteria bacterium RIFCSPLOWO2_01_FULL_38_10]OGE44034.1 MAG: tyrosine--tRNA ligase [Candidatus Daviesbacteria bacterium RIFCSPHIGHO2_12_FULL_38_25]OGE67242.1 MAG: tyrosine--tRNA ligase [Candidatus Daviesbacteria bacterium RIFCSPLOWO2_02_FULL_38_18]OGE71787.1 MAG: tyrosine--tRNA ligase [Candidatus Daviesbacteria bacterium RIFCSPLOWO2_12_FULL_38_10]HBQ51221.
MDEKFRLITRNLEEVLTEEELKALLESGQPLKHYIGFEISGKLHIGYLFVALKIKDLQDAGAETIIWLADLHSAINDKLDGNIETIRKVARGYFTDAFKILFQCVGGDPDKLQFKLTSEEYAKNPDFWMTVLEVGKTTSLARTKRSITIMGREESDDIDTAKLFYPIMQAADIFLLGVNIAHAGIDQRKVHVIARDSASALKKPKPIAIHHPILLGLSAPENITGEADEIAMKAKMSKSKPGSGISIHDSPDQIRQTINGAYAPEGQVENNPILNWTKYLVFYSDGSLVISRKNEHGGDITYSSYDDLEKDYQEKKLHPMDLKMAVAEWLIAKLEPARKYFENPARKTALEEIERLTSFLS